MSKFTLITIIILLITIPNVDIQHQKHISAGEQETIQICEYKSTSTEIYEEHASEGELKIEFSMILYQAWMKYNLIIKLGCLVLSSLFLWKHSEWTERLVTSR